MAVLLETSLGDIVVDLFTKDSPIACKNFLKLCKTKYYNNVLFHNVQKDYVIQTGDPTGTGKGGESIYGRLYGEQAKYFEDEINPERKHDRVGVVAMANKGKNLNGSQFYITTREECEDLDGKHTIFGQLEEGFEVIADINEAYCDGAGRPWVDIRILHTEILDDPFDDPKGMVIPEKSPEPGERADGVTEQVSARIRHDEKIDDYGGLTEEEVVKKRNAQIARSRAEVLEMIGDIDDADQRPPENVLFVCQLNPATEEEDLEIIFGRFGPITRCEVIRDNITDDSLQYAFVEYEHVEDCEEAYYKMDNVLIDDRRIHVGFCQSVARMRKNSKYAEEYMKTGGQRAPRNTTGVTLETKKKAVADKYQMVFDGGAAVGNKEHGSEKRKEKKSRKRSRSRSRERTHDRRGDRGERTRDNGDRGRGRDERRGRDRDRDRR